MCNICEVRFTRCVLVTSAVCGERGGGWKGHTAILTDFSATHRDFFSPKTKTGKKAGHDFYPFRKKGKKKKGEREGGGRK